MPVFIGGAELNVGKALANWGMPVKYCTALPDNYISKEIMESLNEEGIDTSAILLSVIALVVIPCPWERI